MSIIRMLSAFLTIAVIIGVTAYYKRETVTDFACAQEIVQQTDVCVQKNLESYIKTL